MGKAVAKKKQADAILAHLSAKDCADPFNAQFPRVVASCKKSSKLNEKMSAAEQARADAASSAATTQMLTATNTSTAGATATGATDTTIAPTFLGMPQTTGYIVVGVGSLVVLGVIGYLVMGSSSSPAVAAPAK